MGCRTLPLEGQGSAKEKRAVPLRAQTEDALQASPPVDFGPTKKVFCYCWPTYDWLRSDLKKAGIKKKDAMGRVAHFRSFRKTFQTLGVKMGSIHGPRRKGLNDYRCSTE